MTADTSHKYGGGARGARAAAPAAEAAEAFKLYSGSIEFLRGGQVLAVRPCLCKRCGYYAIPRVFGRMTARVMDPLTTQVHDLEHVRPESVGRD